MTRGIGAMDSLKALIITSVANLAVVTTNELPGGKCESKVLEQLLNSELRLSLNCVYLPNQRTNEFAGLSRE